MICRIHNSINSSLWMTLLKQFERPLSLCVHMVEPTALRGTIPSRSRTVHICGGYTIHCPSRFHWLTIVLLPGMVRYGFYLSKYPIRFSSVGVILQFLCILTKINDRLPREKNDENLLQLRMRGVKLFWSRNRILIKLTEKKTDRIQLGCDTHTSVSPNVKLEWNIHNLLIYVLQF